MAEIRNFLERVAAKSPSFVIFGDRLYSIEERGVSPDKAVSGGLEMALMPSLSFEKLEKLDEMIHNEGIYEESKRYVQSVIDEEVKASREASEEKVRLKTLEFIMFEFMPVLLSKKYEDTDFLAGIIDDDPDAAAGYSTSLVDRAKAEIQAWLDKDFGGADYAKTGESPGEKLKIKLLGEERARITTKPIVKRRYSPEQMGLRKEDLSQSVMGNITGCQPFYVLGKDVYELALIENNRRKPDLVFEINGKRYIPHKRALSIDRLADELKERYSHIWHARALEESRDEYSLVKEIIAVNDTKMRQMIELAKLKEYDLGNCGFILHSGNYYVYSRTPKFATQDGRKPGVFWPYERQRVGIIIGWSRRNEKPYSSQRPVIIDKSPYHPCIRDKDGTFSEICNLNRDPSDYDNTIADMGRKLSDAVNVVMGPLNKESLDAHEGHTYFGTPLDKILKQGSLTRQKAINRGYVVVEVIPTEVK